MATTSLMVQLYTEQFYDALVNDVPPLEDEAFLFLDPAKNTVIREIASEEFGGILASGYPSALTIGFTNKAFTEVTLVPPRGRETTFYAPSHVPSPPVIGAGLVILRVREVGIRVDKGANLSLGRAIGAHVYVDQTD